MPSALVTGAGIRVGRAIALALSRAGFSVALHANRSRDAVCAVQEQIQQSGGQASVHLADLSAREDVLRLADEVMELHPSLDVLVNSAALFEQVPFRDVSPAAVDVMRAVNLDAPFFLTQRLLPALEAEAGGLVVNITDILGERSPPGFAHYAITKAALLHLTRALAVELAPKVRVNALSPGTVAFPEDYSAEAREKILRRVPLRREGTPEDIARCVVFLAREAPYVTGQTLDVDGGRSCVP